jgi:hypothetical protein
MGENTLPCCRCEKEFFEYGLIGDTGERMFCFECLKKYDLAISYILFLEKRLNCYLCSKECKEFIPELIDKGNKYLCMKCLQKKNDEYIDELNRWFNEGTEKEKDNKLCEFYMKSGFFDKKEQWSDFKKWLDRQ